MEEGWDVDKTLLERAIEWMKELELEEAKKCQKQQKNKRKSAKNKQKGAKKQKVAEKAKPKEKEVTRNTCDCDGATVDAKLEEWWKAHDGTIPNAKEEKLVAQKLAVSQSILRAFILKQL